MRVARYVALAGVIVAACALSTFWAFLVPIFEAPDETSHFDYAESIADAHHILRVRGGRAVELADPDVAYLSAAVGTDRIAFHPEERVDSAYGTRAYFSGVDAHAPAIPHAFFDLPLHPSPWLLTVYPAGFYALEGAWLDVVSIATPSLTAHFFAARILCVAMLAATLVFAYLTFRELGVHDVLALSMTAIVGMLPLTSFVSSYVQPDNLSFLLVTVVLYLRLAARKRPRDVRLVWLAGLSLGFLAFTKYQFFGVMFVAVVPAIVLSRYRTSDGIRSVRSTCVALLLPAAFLIALQLWIAAAPKSTYVGAYHTPMFRGTLEAAAAQGNLFGYLPHAVGAAVNDFFLLGSSSGSFWGYFGWLDTPLTFGNAPFGALLRTVEAGGTIVVFALMLVRIRRHVRIARRRAAGGDRMRALDYLFARPALTAYLALVAFMIGLYVATDNGFGAQGRNWYPLLVATIFLTVIEAPRALRRPRLVAVARGILLTWFALYATVGSAYAAASIRARYYGAEEMTVLALRSPAALQPLSRNAQGSIDGLQPLIARPEFTQCPLHLTVRQGDAIAIRGWTLDEKAGGPAAGVLIDLGGKVYASAKYGADRADVATVYGPAFDRVGFDAVISTAGLPPGTYPLSVEAVEADRTTYAPFPNRALVTVVQ